MRHQRTTPEALGTDVLIVGAGMAGTAAALAAAETGSSVLVLDRNNDIGGSARLSRGLIWSVAPDASYEAIDPAANMDLLKDVTKELPGTLSWLRQYGLEVGPQIERLYDIGTGFKVGTPMPAVFVLLKEGMKRLGVNVLTGATIEDIRPLDGADRPSWEATCSGAGGSAFSIGAEAVILATGSYAADSTRWHQTFGEKARHFSVRSSPHADGTSLRIAERLQLALAGSFERFYGHLMPFGVQIDPEEFGAITLNLSEHGILLDEQGHRFTDEVRGDWFNAEAVALHTNGRAVLILDSEALKIATTTPRYPGALPFNPIPRIQKLGAPVATAQDPVQLFKKLATLANLPRLESETAIHASIESFNQQALTHDRPSLAVPPFTGMVVAPGITFGKGGLRVDGGLQAIHESGRPCRGLFVAGVDVGGIYHEAYAGGLALAIVLGRRAGQNAAKFALLEGSQV